MWQDLLALLTHADVTLHQHPFWSDEALNWEEFERPKQHQANHWFYTQQSILSGRIIGG